MLVKFHIKMKTDLNKDSKILSKSKINKNLEIIIPSLDIKSQENINVLPKNDESKIFSIVINNKFPETAKNSELNLLNSKKNKLKKGGILISNKDFEDFNKDISSDSETKEKKISSKFISKKRKGKRPKRRKRKYKKKKEIDEDYEDEKELYIFKNNQKSKNDTFNDSEEESDNNIDDKELKDFLNKKACQKKTLLKYKDIYKKKKNNKIIFLKEEDEEEYFKKENNQNKIENENININNNNNIITNINKKEESEIKHFKKLKKNIDNKEMKLPLDTECIICCGIIKELANPDVCNHDFCKSCLFEWSQRSGKCPICKNNYNNIFFYDNGNKKQISLNDIRKIYKKEKNNDKGENDNDDESIEKICYICKKDIDQNNLLKCDRCEAYFCHYYCCKLTNKINKWYCKYCQIDIKVIKESKKKVVHFFM